MSTYAPALMAGGLGTGTAAYTADASIETQTIVNSRNGIAGDSGKCQGRNCTRKVPAV
jgi:hypothetical protein